MKTSWRIPVAIFSIALIVAGGWLLWSALKVIQAQGERRSWPIVTATIFSDQVTLSASESKWGRIDHSTHQLRIKYLVAGREYERELEVSERDMRLLNLLGKPGEKLRLLYNPLNFSEISPVFNSNLGFQLGFGACLLLIGLAIVVGVLQHGEISGRD